MFLRGVLKRWNVRSVDAADGSGAADGCRTTPSLLEELATDSADFADLARVLRLDLRAVVETLAGDHTSTPDELVTALRGRAADEARLARVRALCAGVAEQLAVGADHTSAGTRTDASASSLTLALENIRRRGESSVANWNGESITLSLDDIAQVKRRELSRSRTVAASTVLVAASVGIIVGIAKATGQASGGGGPKPTPNP